MNEVTIVAIESAITRMEMACDVLSNDILLCKENEERERMVKIFKKLRRVIHALKKEI